MVNNNVTKSTLAVSGLILLGSTVLSSNVFATNGFFAHGYGNKHKSLAGAGAAISLSSLSAATNPALLQAAGSRLDMGVEYFKPLRTATTRHDNATYSGDGKASFIIPEFGYSSKINEQWSWGIMMYGNGGMNTEYPSIAVYSGNPNGPKTGVNLEQVFIAPTAAYKISPRHTIGLSANFIYQTFEATGIAGFAPLTPSGTADNLSDVGKDDSTGYSFKLGWLTEVSDHLSFGLAYQTKSEMSKFTKYSELFAEQGNFDIPSNWVVGIKYELSPKMDLLLDMQKINYSDSKAISNPNNSAQGGKLGNDNGPGFGWEDSTVYKLGFNYRTSSTTTLRLGYSKGNQIIGADDTSFNLIAPAVTTKHATFGVTWKLFTKSELSLFYMRALENQVIGNSN
ncbi:MAG: OmpP1/FadL family transporter, partial [Gammaproteobacteria bacterium]